MPCSPMSPSRPPKPITGSRSVRCSTGVQTAAWLRSTLLAVRMSKRDYGEDKPMTQLGQALGELPAEAREAAFWQEAALLEGLRPMKLRTCNPAT
ncbi:MAG: hypothetical protein JWL62_1944 [Hyphomicrobiales bacterium]|nr:hypothetical protein [Hyphomicrobiales bacterium]